MRSDYKSWEVIWEGWMIGRSVHSVYCCNDGGGELAVADGDEEAYLP